jgi:purine catabolism regulator
VAWTLQDLLLEFEIELKLVTQCVNTKRPISWAHVSELEDPSVWLEADEVLLTVGRGLAGDIEDQKNFILKLVGASIAAVGIDARSLAKLEPEVISLAAQLDFPIISVSPTASFNTIIKAIAVNNIDRLEQRVNTQQNLIQALNQLQIDDSPSHLQNILKDLGLRIYACNKRGEPLLKGVETPLPALIDFSQKNQDKNFHIDSTFVYLRADETNLFQGSLFIVSINNGSLRSFSPLGLRTLAELVFSRVKTNAIRTLEQIARSSILISWLKAADSSNQSELKECLTAEGFADGTEQYALVIPAVEQSQLIEIFEWFEFRTFPFLLSKSNDLHTELLVQAPLADIREISEALGCSIGVSKRITNFAQAGYSFIQAKIAYEFSIKQHAVSSSSFTPGSTYLSLLAEKADGMEVTFMPIIGALLSYDSQNGSQLIETLRTFLECNRKAHDAAAKMYIHTNTLKYRLNLIQKITGVNLNSTSVQTDFWIALEALRLWAD